jgi:ABC-type glycerol-3-phosphate transport system substrate-binding protein
MKKLLVILMALGLTVSVFAIGNRQTATTTGGKIPITVGLWEFPKFGGDAWGDFISDKFNVNITPVLQEWSDYQDVLRLQAATNSLPDTFAGYPLNETWFGEFVDQGLIRSIPDAMINKYPNLKRMVDSIQEVGLMRQKLGAYYYIPRAESLTGLLSKAFNSGIYYRRDWAERLGYRERPTDVETLYNMLRDFTTRDPDGNGRNDTYGYIGDVTQIYAAFGAFPGFWVRGPNNQYIPGWADEGPMIQALTWLRRAYTEGVLDPEFTVDYTLVASKFAQDVFGAMARNFGAVWVDRHINEQFGGAHPNIADPLSTAVGWIGGLSARPGGTRYHPPKIDASGTVFRADLSDEKLDKLLEIYDWLVSKEGNDFSNWGFRDIDYRVNANGSFTKIEPRDLREKYPSIIFGQIWPVWPGEFESMDHPDVPQNAKDFAMAYQVAANAAVDNVTVVDKLATITITPERTRFVFDTSAQFTQIITGTADVTTMYRAMMADANARGLQGVITSVNRAR